MGRLIEFKGRFLAKDTWEASCVDHIECPEHPTMMFTWVDLGKKRAEGFVKTAPHKWETKVVTFSKITVWLDEDRWLGFQHEDKALERAMRL